MSTSVSLRAEMMPGKIDDCPADLQCGQTEKLGRGRWTCLIERPVESDGSFLDDIVRRLPALQMRIVAQHPARQPHEASLSRLDHAIECALAAFVSRMCEKVRKL